MRWIAVALLGTLLLGSTLSIETASALLTDLKDQVVSYFDWLFVAVASSTLALVVVLGLHPRANVRLGSDDERPEFSRFSWFAMLFSAGLASGLLYWAAAEPILHHQANPFLAHAGIEGGSAAATQTALRITIFHWGFHGWGLYVLGGLAIGIYSYRHNRPLTIRSALYPILGPRWIDRWPGLAVDSVALVGTIFGVATSAGLSAAALNATLNSLAGIDLTITNQIVIVFAVCGFGVASALTGVDRGIRRLSEVNVWVSGLFLLAVLIAGPTLSLAIRLFTTAGDYLWNVVPMGLWVGDSASETEWQSAWTVFYWGWWLAWMPFVSLFIARISKGRSVREVVFGVIGAPTLVVVVWMTVLGGTALDQELANPGTLSAAVNQDYSLGIVKLLDNLAGPTTALALTGVAAFLLFTWLITSLDSATLVICHLAGTPDSATQQIFWGLTLAALTAALIGVGGTGALQAASIIVGLPLAGVTVLIGAGLVKDLIAGRL